MKKMFCDICGKEINPHIEKKFNLVAEKRDPSDGDTFCEIGIDDVCTSCMKSLEEAIEKLRR